MISPEQQGQFARVYIDKIDADAASNSRSNEPDVSDLERSLAEIGLLEPITVSEKDDGRYRLLFGFRRLRAMKNLGWELAPAMVRPPQQEQDALLMNLAENLSRCELRLYDEVRSIAHLRTLGITIQQISDRTGMPTQRLQNYPAIWNGITPAVKELWSQIPHRSWEPGSQILLRWSKLPATEQLRAYKLWANPDSSPDDDAPPEPMKEKPKRIAIRRFKRKTVHAVEKRAKELIGSKDPIRRAQGRALEWSLGRRQDWK